MSKTKPKLMFLYIFTKKLPNVKVKTTNIAFTLNFYKNRLKQLYNQLYLAARVCSQCL